MSGADFIEYDLSGLDLLFSWTLIMPLKYIRSKVTADNVLSTAIATTAITQELATLLQFPPVSAAASLLQKIFQTIQVGLSYILFCSKRIHIYCRPSRPIEMIVIIWRGAVFRCCLISEIRWMVAGMTLLNHS